MEIVREELRSLKKYKVGDVIGDAESDYVFMIAKSEQGLFGLVNLATGELNEFDNYNQLDFAIDPESYIMNCTLVENYLIEDKERK